MAGVPVESQRFEWSLVGRMLARALLLRCPACGGRKIFRSWLRMRAFCPGCGLRLDRGERGYNLGSYTINLLTAETLFLLWFLVIVLVGWPSPPWSLMQYGGGILMVVAPVFFYPFSKTLFLAVDLVFRPVRLEDLMGHGEGISDPEPKDPP